MKCLACWEEMKDSAKICQHCGSDQKEVKDFFVLALLKQQKRKIVVPEQTEVLQYILAVDPESSKEITITGSSESLPSYQPPKPSFLGRLTGQQTPPVQGQSKSVSATPVARTPPSKVKGKTMVCPSCKEEVPFKKFCKLCGNQLQKECDNCATVNRISAKFCTKCGNVLKTSESDSKEQSS